MQGTSRRILVIEDNPTNLELLMFLLRASGHKPVAARDGVTGLRLAVDMLPDLIICDIQLPTIDGYEVARRIKQDERLKPITLVAVTACAMPADRERSLEAGFDGYITKPISPYTFCEDVSRFLTSAKSQAAAEIDQPAYGADILVAEHSALNRSVLNAVLEPTGCCFRVARAVDEALEIMRNEHPSLLIAELELPGGGAEALVNARCESLTTGQSACLVLLPAGSDEGAAQYLQRLGCDLMRWPIDPPRLLRWMNTHRATTSILEVGVLST